MVLFSLLALAGYTFALPLFGRQAITPASTAQINSYTPYTWFASAGYCSPASTLAWNCGANCNANPGFKPVASGGDGSETQYWFVGYDPALATVIVSHQGTNPQQFLADLTDADFFLTELADSNFPGISTSIQVHSGFKADQERSASSVLAAVKTAMSKYGATKVTCVGHSLGAALSLLDSVYLPLHLPSSTTFRTIVYGLPRVGNQAFADYVDAHLHLTHINNEEDPVPILPGRFLGFHHASGEVHIEDSGEWANCPGQDNPSGQCTVGDVPTIFQGNIADHDGPYNGITMGCSS